MIPPIDLELLLLSVQLFYTGEKCACMFPGQAFGVTAVPRDTWARQQAGVFVGYDGVMKQLEMSPVAIQLIKQRGVCKAP